MKKFQVGKMCLKKKKKTVSPNNFPFHIKYIYNITIFFVIETRRSYSSNFQSKSAKLFPTCILDNHIITGFPFGILSDDDSSNNKSVSLCVSICLYKILLQNVKRIMILL